MDEDTAYVEAVGSSRALSSLQYLGLPIPQDRLGGVLRYQTDHDEVGRATSCGPRTSRLMVQVLAKEAIRLDIPIINQTTGVRLLVELERRAARRRRSGDSPEAPDGGQSSRAHRVPLRLARRRDRRAGRALSRQRVSAALFRLFGSCSGGGTRCGEPDGEPIRHRDVSRSISLESVWDLCRSACPISIRSISRRERAEFSRRLLPDHARTCVERFPERLSVAVPRVPACSTSARASSTLQCSGRLRRDGRCSWTSIEIRSRCPETPSSISTGWMPTSVPISRSPARCSKCLWTVFAR